MTEKSKWFDPKDKQEPLLGLVADSGGVLLSDATEFLADITVQHARGRLPDESFKLFSRLCDMPPAARLSRNLKVVLTLLATQAVRNVLIEGLTEEEKLALRDLEHLRAPPKIRAIAQGLLNVSERQQLVEAVQELYRDERTRRWKAEVGGEC